MLKQNRERLNNMYDELDSITGEKNVREKF